MIQPIYYEPIYLLDLVNYDGFLLSPSSKD